MQTPWKKWQRKSCPHCERKQAAIDRLQDDLEEKNAQLKELSERFDDFKKEKGKQEVAGALKEDKHVCFSAENFNNDFSDINTKIHPPFQNPGSALGGMYQYFGFQFYR